MIRVSESDLEDSILGWLQSIGCQIAHGLEIAPGELFAERHDYTPVVLERRLRDALLPKLISGELRVKDAERFLKERGL